MSRIGNKPIEVPDGVEVGINGTTVTVKGKHGELTLRHHANMTVQFDADKKVVNVSRPDNLPQNRALHGLTRSLVNNMVVGVVNPYEKRLEIVGVGYQGTLNGSKLDLQVGFANTVSLEVPAAVQCELPDNTHIIIKSADKQAVGQFAANIRRVRPPEPYKGKGIRYQNEHVKRKAGKAFAGA